MKNLTKLTLVAVTIIFGLTVSALNASAQMDISKCKEAGKLKAPECLEFLRESGEHPRTAALKALHDSQDKGRMNPASLKDAGFLKDHFAKIFTVLENVKGFKGGAKLEDLKAKLADITNKDDAKRLASDIRDIIKDASKDRRVTLIGYTEKVGNSVSAAIKRLNNTDAALDRLAADGKDVVALKENLKSANAMIGNAGTMLKAVKDKLSGTEDLNFEQIRADLKAIFEKVKSAYEQFKSIATQARALKGETESETK